MKIMTKSILKKITFLVFVLALLAGQFGIAQPIPTCLNLLDLQTNPGGQTFYGPTGGQQPGDTIATLEDVNLIIDQIIQSSGDTVFLDLVVDDLSVTYGSSVIKFDFSDVTERVNRFEIEVISFIGPYYIALNDGQLFEVDSIEHIGRVLPSDAVFNYDVSFAPPGSRRYNFTIDHPNIDNITFGTGETSLVSACYSTSNDCAISDLSFEPEPCTPNGIYYGSIDFRYANTSDSFDLQGNSNNYGRFAYTDLPVRLGPFPGDPNRFISFEVLDALDTLCNDVLSLDPIDCDDDCNIGDIILTPSPCDANDQFSVNLDFRYQNTGPNGFMVIGDGNFYGIFQYTDLPLNLGPFDAGDQPLEFNVFDVADPACINFAELDDVDCDRDTCNIRDVAVSSVCTNSGNFSAYFSFLYDHDGSPIVRVFDENGANIGVGFADRQPIQVAVRSDSTLTRRTFNLCFEDEPDCCERVEFRQPNCSAQCDFVQWGLRNYDCQDDSLFTVEAFVQLRSNSDSVGILVDSLYYGEFPLDNNSFAEVIVRPIVPSTNGLHIITFYDPLRPDCFVIDTIVSPDCGNSCLISNLQITPDSCLTDTTLTLTLDFDYQNANNDFFDVFDERGNIVGTYRLNQLPIFITDFPKTGRDFQELSVCINDNPDCCIDAQFRAPRCVPNNCSITNLIVELEDCDSNSQYFITVDFDYTSDVDRFNLDLGNGFVYRFLTQMLPVRIGLLDASAIYDLRVYNPDQSTCAATTQFGPNDCLPPVCPISNARVTDTITCNRDGSYLVPFDFDFDSNIERIFNIVDERGLRVFRTSTSALPASMLLYPSDTTFRTLNICIENLPNCCTTIRFDEPDCDPQCRFGFVDIVDYECVDDSTFYATAVVEILNPNDSFNIDINGNFFGQYEYDAPSTRVRIGPFESNNSQTGWVNFYDPTDPDCAAGDTLFNFNCDTCYFSDLDIQLGDCDSNGVYYATLDFDYQNVSDSFRITLENQSYSYSFADLPIQLGPLLNFSSYFLRVEGINGVSCTKTTTFGPNNCPPPVCPISNANVTDISCKRDGNFTVTVNFDYNVPVDRNFIVKNERGSSVYFGSTANLPATFTVSAEDTLSVRNLDICISNIQNCCVPFSFDQPECESLCRFQYRTLTDYSCTSDSSFYVTAIVEMREPNDSFVIEIDSIFKGYYEYQSPQTTVRIGPFPSNTNQPREVKFYDPLDPDCSTLDTLENFDCIDNCRFSNINVYSVDCNPDGSYQLILDFEVKNPVSDQFRVYSRSGLVGIYNYRDLPIFINSFEGQGVNNEVLLIRDFRDAFCISQTTFQGLNCGDCSIFDLTVSPVDCASGSYYVSVDFEYDGVGNIGFQVIGNGNTYGSYNYRDLPVTLGPFSDDTLDVREFIVYDLVNFNCRDEAILRVPDCTDNCIGFESPTIDTTITYTAFDYGLNDTIFTVEGVPVYLDSFLQTTGGNMSRDGRLLIPSFQNQGNFQGNVLFTQEINLRFDFSVLADEVVELTFDASESGGHRNIQVNGENLYFFTNYSELPSNIANGVLYSRDTGTTVTLTGKIEELVIGGEDLTFDNLCYTLQSNTIRIWPGDTNLDSIANHLDLLNVGLGFGIQGPARTDRAINWEGKAGQDWASSLDNSNINLKHADANGDGIIDEKDVEAIERNYGLMHGTPLPFSWGLGSPTDPEFYVDLEAATPTVGQQFSAPIILGTPNNQIEDIYGIAFTIRYTGGSVTPLNAKVEINDSWLGDVADDLLTIQQTQLADGLIEVAITRKDGQNISGSGSIGYFIGIIDNVSGKAQIEVDILNVKGIDFQEGPVTVFNRGTSTDVLTNTNEPMLGKHLMVYPNPSRDLVHFDMQGKERIYQMAVYNAYGQMVKMVNEQEYKLSVDVSNWPGGFYFAEIQVDGGFVTRKFEVIK